jgi:hypothetical protein
MSIHTLNVAARRFVCLAAIVALVGLPVSTLRAAETIELVDLIDKVEQSVVRIDVEMDDGKAIGSGYVVDVSGLVATNYHVMAGAKTATVTFKNGDKANVAGTLMLDGKRDVAIIKIEKDSLTPLKLAEALPRKGETVVAFGAPKGLSFSASEGIVSAIREGKELTDYVEDLPGTWLQTTAPISSGNSGGPLVNRNGAVVGMNTMVLATGQNLNFAISSVDIGVVLQKASAQKLVALTEGAAKARPSQKRSKRSNDMIPEDVPVASIDSYINNGKGGRTAAVADLRKNFKEAREKLQGYKTGQISDLAFQAKAEANADYVVNRIKGQLYYLFPDADTKDKAVKSQQKLCQTAEDLLKKVEDPKAGLLNYLSKAGPELNLNAVGEVGCVPEIEVGQVIGDDEFLALVNSRPIAVRGIKTASIANGAKLDGRVMYVSGNQTFPTKSGSIHTVFVLRELPLDLLAKRLNLGDSSAKSESASATAKSQPAAKSTTPQTTSAVTTASTKGAETKPAPATKEAEYRTWTDKSGKFKIEAKLLAKTADKVILERRDGEAITVPSASLSQADLDFLK